MTVAELLNKLKQELTVSEAEENVERTRMAGKVFGKEFVKSILASFSDDEEEDEVEPEPEPEPETGVDPMKLPKKVKVECRSCNLCGEKTRKEVRSKEWDDCGPSDHDRGMRKLNDSSSGKSRFCPDFTLVKGKPIPAEDLDREEEEEEEGPPDTSWLEETDYGPKCRDCGAGRGEDHCKTCPNREKCSVDEAVRIWGATSASKSKTR